MVAETRRLSQSVKIALKCDLYRRGEERIDGYVNIKPTTKAVFDA